MILEILVAILLPGENGHKKISENTQFIFLSQVQQTSAMTLTLSYISGYYSSTIKTNIGLHYYCFVALLVFYNHAIAALHTGGQ